MLPSVRIQDNLQLPANTYVLYGSRRSRPARATSGPTCCWSWTRAATRSPCQAKLPDEPTFGLPGHVGRRAPARRPCSAATPWSTRPTVITTHLTEVVKDNMAELLSYAETQKLLDELPTRSSRS